LLHICLANEVGVAAQKHAIFIVHVTVCRIRWC